MLPASPWKSEPGGGLHVAGEVRRERVAQKGLQVAKKSFSSARSSSKHHTAPRKCHPPLAACSEGPWVCQAARAPTELRGCRLHESGPVFSMPGNTGALQTTASEAPAFLLPRATYPHGGWGQQDPGGSWPPGTRRELHRCCRWGQLLRPSPLQGLPGFPAAPYWGNRVGGQLQPQAAQRLLTDARPAVRVEGVLLVAPAHGARVCVLAAVLAAPVSIVTGY